MKAPVLESLFLKITGSACNFIKKETLSQVFSCEFYKIVKNRKISEYLQVTASALSIIKILWPSLLSNKIETRVFRTLIEYFA